MRERRGNEPPTAEERGRWRSAVDGSSEVIEVEVTTAQRDRCCSVWLFHPSMSPLCGAWEGDDGWKLRVSDVVALSPSASPLASLSLRVS